MSPAFAHSCRPAHRRRRPLALYKYIDLSPHAFHAADARPSLCLRPGRPTEPIFDPHRAPPRSLSKQQSRRRNEAHEGLWTIRLSGARGSFPTRQNMDGRNQTKTDGLHRPTTAELSIFSAMLPSLKRGVLSVKRPLGRPSRSYAF